jgi:hypothetical protein
MPQYLRETEDRAPGTPDSLASKIGNHKYFAESVEKP